MTWKQALWVALVLLPGVGLVSAQEQTATFTGFMSDDVPDDAYPVALQPGGIITVTADAISGDLDTYIVLEDAAGNAVAENDDRGDGSLNSQYTYTSAAGGSYVVVVSNYPGSGGDYRVTISISGGGALPEASEPSAPSNTAPPATSAEETIPFSANAVEYTGYMGDDVSDERYDVPVQAGQLIRAVLVAAAGSALDPYLALEDSEGKTVRENDDRGDGTFNSELFYTAEQAGTFTVVVSNYPDSSGDYVLTVDVLDPAEAEVLLANVADLARGISLSGAPQVRETEHFRIHYTLEGSDATTQAYVDAIAQAVEEVWQIQIAQSGWNQPPGDGDLGGDGRIDIYISDLLKEDGEGALGTASIGDEYGDNPNTPALEAYATHSYLTLDNDLDAANEGGISPFSLLRATIAHEFHHAVQHGYDLRDAHLWYYESTSTWMETFTFPQEQDATGYVENNYQYPEICFGADGEADPTGLLMYGDWMFMQSLVDAHGESIMQELWNNIAVEEGFAPLATTLAAHGEAIPQAVARYRLQNLARDYELAPLFGATVWLENVIAGAGSWQPTGRGIQEMGANYFEIAMPSGAYAVTFSQANPNLQLWAVGIRKAEADSILLGSSGVINTTGYDRYYLMVFNTQYDDDVEACVYQNYAIDIKPDAGSAPARTYVWNATHFEPPVMQN